ncbi:hypothetical protein O181_093376 [Austropuccinia psidii MF-1]|uniref:Uncharacterized protein n=1 Tax=Austropuccinia psidii MF-1 TaxID=1389203 RepID=A0A9Q3J163_9BASI|nr:hypothetical protein [Austropuccinia psidii MF-1]
MLSGSTNNNKHQQATNEKQKKIKVTSTIDRKLDRFELKCTKAKPKTKSECQRYSSVPVLFAASNDEGQQKREEIGRKLRAKSLDAERFEGYCLGSEASGTVEEIRLGNCK